MTKMTEPHRYPDGGVIMDEHATASHVAELSAENAALRAEVERLRNHLMWIGARKHPKQELHPLQKMARAALGEGGE